MASPVEESLRLAEGALARGRVEESRGRCEALMRLAPEDPGVLHLAAVLELSAGNARAALPLVERALRANPAEARQHHTRGLALRALQRDAEAAGAFREAAALSPGFAQAHAALGRALLATGDAAGAIDALSRAIAANPQAFDAHNDLGVALLEERRPGEAEACFRRAMALAPHRSHAWNNLGNALRSAGRAEEALAAFRGAAQREPPLAGAWTNLGNMLREHDRVAEALECFDRALAIEPANAAARFSSSIARLVDDDLERGFADYGWRKQAGPDAAQRAALASLQPGQVVEIEGEQGLGDVLFFLRWAPRLTERGARLRFRGDARLFPLLEPLGWFESFLAPADEPAAPAWKVSVADLPWLTQGPAREHPASIPLKAAAGAVEAAQRLLASAGPPPYVGVAWRAGIASPAGGEHLFKEVPIGLLAGALKGVAVTVVSLQRDPSPRQAAELASVIGRPVLDASALNADLGAALGVLDAIDDHVGVSSTNVHLRAALGKGSRVLVPVPPEWRYGRAGDATPWFPASRLYRESREHGWQPAMAALAADLRARHGTAP